MDGVSVELVQGKAGDAERRPPHAYERLGITPGGKAAWAAICAINSGQLIGWPLSRSTRAAASRALSLREVDNAAMDGVAGTGAAGG